MRIVLNPARRSRNRRALSALVILFFLHPAPCAAAQPEHVPRDPHREVAQWLEPWITAEMKRKSIPALSIALVDDQKIVWAQRFWICRSCQTRSRHRPIRSIASAQFRSYSQTWRSCSSSSRARSISMRLFPLTVPEFAPKNPYKGVITLRHLMSHRSGLVREPPVGHYFDPSPPSLDDVVKSLAHTSLVFEPGTRTKYSNAGITVVGAVIEKVAGKPFAAAIDRALLRPLGMTRSSFQPGPELSAQTGARNDVDLRRPDRRHTHFPAGYRTRRKHRLIRRRPGPFSELPLRRTANRRMAI